MADLTQIHAACVSLGGRGVLLLGASGSGKSDLALRLIDGGAVLVADDRVQMARLAQRLVASAPARLRGLLEVRGIGILTLPHMEKTEVALAVRLMESAAIERMPQPEFWSCLDVQVPLLSLHAFDGSTCAKIRMFLQHKDNT